MVTCKYFWVFTLPTLAILAGCVTTKTPEYEKTVTSVAFSPDHTLLAFANSLEIHVLDVESRVPVSTLRQLPQDIEGADPKNFRYGVGDSMVFLDNNRIASTGMGGLVSIWDVRSGRRLSVIDSWFEEEFASTIDYSPANNRLIIGTSVGQVLLTGLDNNDAGPLMPVAKLAGYVWDLQFGPDGRYFASASREPEIYADSDASTSPAAGQINEGSTDADYDQIAEPADRSNVAIWDAEQLEKVGDLDGAREVFKMALVPGERALLTAGDDVKIWEFLTLQQASQVRDPSMVMQGIGVGTMMVVSVVGLAAGAALGAPFMAFDPLMSTQLALLPVAMMLRSEACLRTAAISPDGQTIVSTTKGPSHSVMAVIDRANDKVVEKWTADFYVCDMAFSPNGNHLLTATSSGVFIYDTVNWKKERLDRSK
jgi:WD40 repeat protein